MALMKLAAGLAAGYVLGARAGRDKYEKIAETARNLTAHPTAVKAQVTTKPLINADADAVNAEPDAAAGEQLATPPVASTTATRPARRKPAPRDSALPSPGASSL